MTTWDPAHDPDSPDRVDALVWAITELMLTGGPWGSGQPMSGVA